MRFPSGFFYDSHCQFSNTGRRNKYSKKRVELYRRRYKPPIPLCGFGWMLFAFSRDLSKDRMEADGRDGHDRSHDLPANAIGNKYVGPTLQSDQNLRGPRVTWSRRGCPLTAFAVSAARVWNSLPSDVITSPSLIAFKRRLNTLLFSRSFDL